MSCQKLKTCILGNKEILREYQNWIGIQSSPQSSSNKFLEIAIKHYEKGYIKAFCSWPILLDFLILAI